MKRLIVVMLSILSGVMLMACAAPPAEETAPGPQPEVLLARWSSRGIKTTEPVTVSKAPWAVVWTFQPDKPDNTLQIVVKQVGNDLYRKPVVNISNVEERKTDSFYIYDEGKFFLEIHSIGGTWDIQVFGSR